MKQNYMIVLSNFYFIHIPIKKIRLNTNDIELKNVKY